MTRQQGDRISGIRLRWGGAAGFALILLPLVVAISAQAQHFKVLHTFTGADGASPVARLIRDTAGNFYGATRSGGVGNGTVFKMNKNGKETASYSILGGHNVFSGVARDAAGGLYGTTFSGGIQGCSMGFGCGIVFKANGSGAQMVIYRFTGGADGANPEGGVVLDAAGNLYSTTTGGDTGFGNVFKLSKTGKETVLHNFNGSDGSAPLGELVRDPAGNLYGTAGFGGIGSCGFGCGTVFKLDKTGQETVLYSFTGGTDGGNPVSGVIRDAAGNLYGTTRQGGNLSCLSGSGCGVVFKLDMTDKLTVLHSFTGLMEKIQRRG